MNPRFPFKFIDYKTYDVIDAATILLAIGRCGLDFILLLKRLKLDAGTVIQLCLLVLDSPQLHNNDIMFNITM